MRTAADGGPLRTEFTYRKSFMTSADFSPTTGRDIYAEGAAEGLYRSILTTDCETAKFQFQNCAITWTTRNGDEREYTFDGGRITTAGEERYFEVKAHGSYFQDPDIASTLAAAEDELARRGIGLDRIDGCALLEPVRLRVVLEVLRFRNAPFEPKHTARVREAIARHGGTAPLGLVREAIDLGLRQGFAVACAMLVRREIGFAVDQPLTPDTPVHIFTAPARRLTGWSD